jgi:hypothetical protein
MRTKCWSRCLEVEDSLEDLDIYGRFNYNFEPKIICGKFCTGYFQLMVRSNRRFLRVR